MTSPDLQRLMLAALEGDGSAYRRFLEQLRPKLEGYLARRMGRDRSDVEDLVQEILIAIHTKRATFDRAQPVTAWVYAIARYKLIDHYRRTGRRIHVPLEDAGALSVEDGSAGVDARQDIERGLSALSARARDLVRSVKLNEESIAHVAARTGMSEGAVKVGVHRGVLKLAERLRGGDGKGPA